MGRAGPFSFFCEMLTARLSIWIGGPENVKLDIENKCSEVPRSIKLLVCDCNENFINMSEDWMSGF